MVELVVIVIMVVAEGAEVLDFLQLLQLIHNQDQDLQEMVMEALVHLVLQLQ